MIDNIEKDTQIKIYYDKQELNYSVINKENNKIKINLKSPKSTDQLMFFVDDNEYKIGLYQDSGFRKTILSKDIKNEKVIIPDDNWIITNLVELTTEEKMEENSLVKLLDEKTECSYKEKYVYKYDIIREYYDDDYHLNVDGYIKDINNYKVFYKGEPVTNVIEITNQKIIEVPKTEYVYIEKEIHNQDSSNKINKKNVVTRTIIKNQIIEKMVSKIPKSVYIVTTLLLIIIIFLIFKTIKKNVE